MHQKWCLFLQLAAEKKDKKIQMRHHNIFAVLCICFGTSASKDSKYLVSVRIYQLILHHPFQVQKCDYTGLHSRNSLREICISFGFGLQNKCLYCRWQNCSRIFLRLNRLKIQNYSIVDLELWILSQNTSSI